MPPSSRTISAIHQVVGDTFESLPREVREAHDHEGALTLKGVAESDIGGGISRRLVCALIGLPRHGAGQPVSVTLQTAGNGVDFWQRNFSGRRYQSHLAPGRGANAGKLVERQGLLTNIFALRAEPDRLVFELIGFAFCFVPLPRLLSPRCLAFETARDGKFVFDIAVDMPLLGRLIHYRGALSADGS